MVSFKDLTINKKISFFIFNNLLLILFGIFFLNTYLDNTYFKDTYYKNIFLVFYFVLISLLQFILLKIYIINPIKSLLSNIEKSKNRNSFTKLSTYDEIGKISLEFSLAKELLKNSTINLDNIIKNKTAEIELANEELKNLNIQSAKKEKFLETLLESIPFPIFYKNEHFRYIKCNTAFADFLGKSKKDIYGKTVFELASPRLAEIYHKEDKKLFENGMVQKYNGFVEDENGNVRNVTFNKSICIYDGKKIGIVGLITELKEE